MNILYIAEITGKAGVWLVKTQVSNLKEKYKAAPISMKTKIFFPHNKPLTASTIL